MKEIDKDLLYSSARGELNTIKKLIAEGADPNCIDRHGNTPLSNAVWEGNLPALDLLVELGADFQIRNNEGYGLLWHASFNAQKSSVE